MRRSLFVSLIVLSALVPLSAFAHAVVRPSEAKGGSYQTFTLGVPTEGNSPTRSVRLVVPDGIGSITPNVMSGWKAEKRLSDDGKRVEEVVWTGDIPPGYRAAFDFSVKVPTSTPELDWKVYQTFADGSTMAWDMDPEMQIAMDHSDMAKSSMGPYSITKVTSDATTSAVTKDTASDANAMAGIALALSAVSLAFSLRKRR